MHTLTNSFLRFAIVALVLALALIAAACQSGPTPAPGAGGAQNFATSAAVPTIGAPATRQSLAAVPGTPGKALNLKGNFAYVGNDGNLTVQNANTGETRVLVKTGTAGYAQFPAFSPDGKQLAYAFSAFTKEGLVKSEVRVINLDGSGERSILAPADEKITLVYPRWSPDGKAIYVTQLYPVPPQGQKAEVDRVTVADGKSVKVIDNAGDQAISPDGKYIAYLQIDFATYATSLWIAGSDGTGGKQLVDSATFLTVASPHFSPDSQSIVFAVSGPAKKKLPGIPYALRPETTPDGCLLRLAFACLLERAGANGLPWDLWSVDVTGSKFERLTDIGADSPVPAWDPEGKYVAFFDTTGIYLVDRASKAIYQVATLGGHGSFDWGR
jgi:Tol biopolymer transport system component